MSDCTPVVEDGLGLLAEKLAGLPVPARRAWRTRHVDYSSATDLV